MTDEKDAKRAKYVAKVRKAYRDGELTEEQAAALREAGVDLDGRQSFIPGVNDLATMNPGLAAEWHPTKNGGLKPADVKARSSRKVWWRHWCEKTRSWHEWKSAIGCRSRKGNECPYCTNRKVLPGFNDLATTHPALASQWHPTKNGELTPKDVTAGSKKKVWWRHRLECGSWHEWEGRIKSRTGGTARCPICVAESRKKTVRCIETGRIYQSLAEAAKDVGLKTSKPIQLFLSGERKTAGGFHWEYVDGNGKEGESE